jgi:hypothetical protein
MRLRRPLQTGALALLAASLALAAVATRPDKAKTVSTQGDARPAAQVALAAPPPPPLPAPAPAPANVPVYDAAAVLAAATPKAEAPKVETAPVAAAKPLLPERVPAPAPRRRETPRAEPQPPRESPLADPPARPWETTSAAPAPSPVPAPLEPRFLEPPAPPAKPATTGGLRPGRYPALAVDYQSIGLDRYVRATEAAGGAFFAYFGTRGIGPQVSLAEGRPAAPAAPERLAIERPYLVSDPAIEAKLRALGLPEEASRDSVVMLWPRDLDRRAWRAIEQALQDEALSGDQVAQVDARFGEEAELEIVGFTLAGDRVQRRLPKPRKVAVPAS